MLTTCWVWLHSTSTYVQLSWVNNHTTSAFFTTDAFSHYLNICSLLLTKCCHFAQLSLHVKSERYRKHVTNTEKPLLPDLLLCKSVSALQSQNCRHKLLTVQHQKSNINTAELTASKLIELLQQSAVEHLTKFC